MMIRGAPILGDPLQEAGTSGTEVEKRRTRQGARDPVGRGPTGDGGDRAMASTRIESGEPEDHA